jgi:hypothetical protein
MNTITKIAAILTLTAGITFGQTVYTWIGGSNGVWNNASSWNPARTNGQVTDVLVFNCGSQVFVNGVQQQTIGQLFISNNTSVILIPASGNPRTLSINGNSGNDLTVEAGSGLQISGNDPSLGIILKTGTTASINGTITLRGSVNHTINAVDENSIVFNNGSAFIQDCPGFAFTNTGNSNVAKFKNGSVFISRHPASSNIFGLQAPASKVVFEHGSTYSQQNSTMPEGMFSGRTYANLEFDLNVNVQYAEHMISDVTVDNLTVKNNCIFSFSNINSTYNTSINVKGDLNINGSFAVTGSKTALRFSGNNTQNISGSGTINLPASMTEVRIENANGVNLLNNLSAGCPVNVSGKLNLMNRILTANVNVLQSGIILNSTGYVNGRLSKYVSPSNPNLLFETGTDNGYSPVSLSFVDLENTGYVSVMAVQTTHPLIGNPSEAMQRYWSISGSGLNFQTYDASFKYLSEDFNSKLFRAN